MKIKEGDMVLVKYNSHYPKPIKVVKVYPEGTFFLRGARDVHGKYLFFREHEVWTNEVWNSPLFRAINED
jgi:hypothetical protein